MQIGVGIFTFQKSIAGIVGNDGWIAIMFSAASVLVVIRLIYYILDDGMTIADIHTRFFGKYVGKIVDVFLYSLFLFVRFYHRCYLCGYGHHLGIS